MPVLESTDHITPKSILRHRPIGKDDTQAATITPPAVKRASRTQPHTEDAHVEVDEWQRADEGDDAPSPVQVPSRRTGVTPVSKAPPKTPLPTASPSSRALPNAIRKRSGG